MHYIRIQRSETLTRRQDVCDRTAQFIAHVFTKKKKKIHLYNLKTEIPSRLFSYDENLVLARN